MKYMSSYAFTEPIRNHHYYVTLESGRSFVLKSTGDWYTAAYDAHEEAKLMDDYLIDVIPIES